MSNQSFTDIMRIGVITGAELRTNVGLICISTSNVSSNGIVVLLTGDQHLRKDEWNRAQAANHAPSNQMAI